jgi:hypothetical protein
MGSPKIPAAPAAPDYAAANREAIQTDISTLPTRRLIEQAAQLGTRVTYVDPSSGKETVADFSGLGDLAAAQQMAKLLGETNADVQRQQLELREELGVRNAQQTSKEVAAADPAAYAIRNQLTGQIGEALGRPGEQLGGYQGLYDVATRVQGGDPSTDALNYGLQQALADYQRGGKLDPATERYLTDNVRSGQAARGNYLGDAAAVQEAATMGQAAEARRAQALQQLLGVQAQAFGQGQQQNQLALGAAQAAAGEQRSARTETFGRQQQGLANASSIVLGQPITNQFGALGGAQQGAVGFNPVGAGGLSNLNPGAGAQGAQWAQQNYGNAMNAWSTQANIAAQGNPWMGLLGSAAGAGVGAGVAALV